MREHAKKIAGDVIYRRELSRRRASAAAVADASARPYLDLHPDSLALDAVIRGGGPRAVINLLLPDARPRRMFAGARTAVAFAARLAATTGMPLRVISFRGMSDQDASALRSVISETAELDEVQVEDVLSPWQSGTHDDDVWIATHWTTAHCLQIRAQRGLLDAGASFYLIQDFEPAFMAASTDRALAENTYRAGLVPVVNTSVLAGYLSDSGVSGIGADRVFAPELDFERLRENAAAADTPAQPLIYFYGRPSKPRNMFQLGVSALAVCAEKLAHEGISASFVSIGEQHPEIDLGSGARLRVAGRLGWAEYFQRLATGTALLSLQATPHPSHPPLDMVALGRPAVTNELNGSRGGLHPRLAAVDPDPVLMAEALVAAVHDTSPSPGFDAEFVSRLGRPMLEVVETVAGQLDRRG
ncbi:hypothetical protein ACMYYO_04615 [Dermacoccaceae bacterium W4C1]